jgi:hypothetical protein
LSIFHTPHSSIALKMWYVRGTSPFLYQIIPLLNRFKNLPQALPYHQNVPYRINKSVQGLKECLGPRLLDLKEVLK